MCQQSKLGESWWREGRDGGLAVGTERLRDLVSRVEADAKEGTS